MIRAAGGHAEHSASRTLCSGLQEITEGTIPVGFPGRSFPPAGTGPYHGRRRSYTCQTAQGCPSAQQRKIQSSDQWSPVGVTEGCHLVGLVLFSPKALALKKFAKKKTCTLTPASIPPKFSFRYACCRQGTPIPQWSQTRKASSYKQRSMFGEPGIIQAQCWGSSPRSSAAPWESLCLGA